MLQEIKGYPNEKVISRYEIKNGNIIVRYLDGSKDVFENTIRNEKEIVSIMEQQANMFVSSNKDSLATQKITKNKQKMLNKKVINLILIALTDLLAIAGIVLLPVPLKVIACSILLTVGAKSIHNVYKTTRLLEDIDKYKLFIDNKQVLEEQYPKIVKKEKALTNNKAKNLEKPTINNIDIYKIDDLKYMLQKVERYGLIDEEVALETDSIKKTGKTKTLGIYPKR